MTGLQQCARAGDYQACPSTHQDAAQVSRRVHILGENASTLTEIGKITLAKLSVHSLECSSSSKSKLQAICGCESKLTDMNVHLLRQLGQQMIFVVI